MKRIICVMLTLIMLVSLVPAAALTADAATLATSSASISVLKKMLTFKSECYQVDGTKEFRIGYGSICTEPHKDSEFKDGKWMGVGFVANENLYQPNAMPHHKINEKTADNMLAAEMKKMDKEVNSFASSNKLTLKQGQFDALSVFSYLTGTTWMKGSGNVKTAVINKADSTKLMNAFNAVLNNQERSKILVNMYMNGIYSNDVSENYSQVTYNANGGDMAVENISFKLGKAADGSKTYTMYFDASKSVAHPVTPTRKGFKFLGWYYEVKDSEYPGARSTALDSNCKDATLVAVWQDNNANADNAYQLAMGVRYTTTASKLAADCVYQKPDKNLPWKTNGKNLKATDYYGKDAFEVLLEYVATDGTRWGCTNPAGDWVRLASGSSGSSGSSSSGSSSGGGGSWIGVTVTNAYVNVRKTASIYAAKAGTLNYNDKVYITSTENKDGFLWGHAHKSGGDEIGWIALMYTDYNAVKNEQSGSSSSTPKPSNTVIAKATVTYNGYLNMRDVPSTGKIVGSLAKNEIVSIYEIKTVNGHQWGRTNGGWICLTYTNVEMVKGSSDISNSGSNYYIFTAKAKPINAERLSVYEDATSESNLVDAEHAPKLDDTVSLITMRIRNNKLWAKIGWTYTYKDDKNKEKKATKYGWVLADGNPDNGLYVQAGGDNINLNATKFTVVADTVNARRDADTASTVVSKLNKGYEFQVNKITPFEEEIWGYTKLPLNSDNGEEYGWVNLATKYAQRSDQIKAPSAPKDETPKDKDFATIIGADRVNVRAEPKISGKFVGQLARGAVVEILDWENGWYRVDADVDNNSSTQSWVYGEYVEETHQSSDIANAPSSHGTGVVANTYAGVNVRTGPSTGHAIVGNKLLPGTQVKILETTYTGVTKWGRIDKGWVCMDYITMTSETVDVPEAPKPQAPNGGSWVGDYDEVDRTTTTAVYTGKANGPVRIWANTQHHDETDTSHVVRNLSDGDPITIYELIAVEERVEIKQEIDVDPDGDEDILDREHSNDKEDVGDRYEIVTHYWARTNDGYIINPQDNIRLNALDEKPHTLTGSATLNVRTDAGVNNAEIGKLEKGDVVKVTALKIVKDKVWGRIEYSEDDIKVVDGWIQLDFMAEGALYKEPEETKPPVTETPAPPANNNNNSMGDTGKNNGTYRYDGKVINTQELNVRAQASDGSAIVAKAQSGKTLYIYDTTISNGMAWGRTDGGYVYLYYVDLIPRDTTYVDARVVFNPGTPIYSDANRTEKVGSYQSMATIDIYEIVGNMARTELGWVSTGDLLN